MADITDVDLKKPHYKRGAKHLILGDFDYKYLCTPQWPYGSKKRDPPHFFGKDDWLGVLTAMVVGAQHCMAMVGGLIVPPLLVVPFGTPDADHYKQYLVQAAMIVTGIMTIFQVWGGRPLTRCGLPNFQWGAGVLSVMGISFTTLPIAQSVIATLSKQKGYTFSEGYGAVLGTLCVSTITPFFISLFPIKAIKRVFPPIVTGVTIILIGIHLTGAGMNNWGGGAYCSANYQKGVLCAGNGNVMLPFGSPRYVGMGFLVFVTIIIVEIFGSPFMRNCSAILGLLLGYIVAAASTVDGNRWVTSAAFDQAPVITFIWTTTFPLSFYAPALIPLIICALITGVESVGDTVATMEASRLQTDTPEAALRVKGALFNDAVSGLFSALATSLPLTTFAQNNGVISLTNVASRQSGFACAGWLIFFGIMGKVGAFIVSIPNCVLGGMTTFLFANVISSGVKIIVSQGTLDRRSRFIMGCSLALGIGVELVPQWATANLWPVTPGMSSAVVGIRDAVILVLSTSFCLGAVVSFLLNLIMPLEAQDKGLAAYEESRRTKSQAALAADNADEEARSEESSHGDDKAVTKTPSSFEAPPAVEMTGAPVPPKAS